MISTHAKPVILIAALLAWPALAAVTSQEAEALKKTLTPFGGERAANKEGTIPLWDGGLKVSSHPDGRIPDLFADDKPLFVITQANVSQYADKLSEGTKALLAKHPTFKVPVYQTRRTASAPQWVYDNTFQNAARAKLATGTMGAYPTGAFGGIPFPIPKNGEEAIWNHLLRWSGAQVILGSTQVKMTPDGKMVVVQEVEGTSQFPYYYADSNLQKWEAEYPYTVLLRGDTSGPPIRAGERTLVRTNVDDSKSQSYSYLTGQRRVRRLPLACCDVPSPTSGGIVNFDENNTFFASTGRYDWKLIEKQEMYIPYNMNKFHQPESLAAVYGPQHPNPDMMRFELHRVWVVEATLKSGQRHVVPRARFYLDEDTWLAVLADRWDAQGKLWKASFLTPTAIPNVPLIASGNFMTFDLQRGGYYAIAVNPAHAKGKGMRFMEKLRPASYFTPESLAGDGVR